MNSTVVLTSLFTALFTGGGLSAIFKIYLTHREKVQKQKWVEIQPVVLFLNTRLTALQAEFKELEDKELECQKEMYKMKLNQNLLIQIAWHSPNKSEADITLLESIKPFDLEDANASGSEGSVD